MSYNNSRQLHAEAIYCKLKAEEGFTIEGKVCCLSWKEELYFHSPKCLFFPWFSHLVVVSLSQHTMRNLILKQLSLLQYYSANIQLLSDIWRGLSKKGTKRKMPSSQFLFDWRSRYSVPQLILQDSRILLLIDILLYSIIVMKQNSAARQLQLIIGNEWSNHLICISKIQNTEPASIFWVAVSFFENVVVHISCFMAIPPHLWTLPRLPLLPSPPLCFLSPVPSSFRTIHLPNSVPSSQV